ncbi:MAG TPA: helix-turn-helix domain-containing protein [Candidatus Sabulitectum sp.]|mgnify:CR=1 FL=1|nr:helix-turn-helix domain-containing protein [Candidatus Sabulitectum sp.]HPF32649.1 helix-turn-helix domain-containing protein [Candidatus Sabulitectum sp.]HPJ27751.1 helix-turn-helix domain-containing protein [Candidatus Sabulitectum sp.]HPR21705.1 helix-turn-helix domain-containing protein [Candidatus Sabulitectum sp.]
MLDNSNDSAYGHVTSVKEFGEKIRRKRKMLGLTLKHVAGLSGIGPRYLSELERGKNTIEMGKALRVANSLGLELIVMSRSRLQMKDN